MRFIKTTLFSALALMAAGYLVPGFVIQNFTTALIAALALGVVNAVIRPVMILFTLPINILSLGLFTFIINALLIGVVAFFVAGFSIAGFLPALLGSIVVSIVSCVLNFVFKD